MNLTEDEMDGLNEIVNIGVGRAASSLSELIGSRINLRIPQVHLVEATSDLLKSESGMLVIQGFSGNVSGNALLLFPPESGHQLAALLGGYEHGETIADFELSGILSEIGNIVLNGVLGSLANAIAADLEYRVPEFYPTDSVMEQIEDSLGEDDAMGPTLVADAEFSVDDSDIQGSVMIVFRLGSLQNLLNRLEVAFQ